jgi:hypothetical protein
VIKPWSLLIDPDIDNLDSTLHFSLNEIAAAVVDRMHVHKHTFLIITQQNIIYQLMPHFWFNSSLSGLTESYCLSGTACIAPAKYYWYPNGSLIKLSRASRSSRPESPSLPVAIAMSINSFRSQPRSSNHYSNNGNVILVYDCLLCHVEVPWPCRVAHEAGFKHERNYRSRREEARQRGLHELAVETLTQSYQNLKATSESSSKSSPPAVVLKNGPVP